MVTYPVTLMVPILSPQWLGRLAKEGAKYGLKGLVADPEEEDMDDLQKIKVNNNKEDCRIKISTFNFIGK